PGQWPSAGGTSQGPPYITDLQPGEQAGGTGSAVSDWDQTNSPTPYGFKFGVQGNITVSGTVYADPNAYGHKQGNMAGQGGATVSLYPNGTQNQGTGLITCQGTAVASSTSQSNGSYSLGPKITPNGVTTLTAGVDSAETA